MFIVNSLSFFYSHRMPIAVEALKNNYKVIVAYGVDPKSQISKFEKLGICIKKITVPLDSKISIIGEIKSFYSFGKLLFNEKPDIVHLITIRPYLYGGIFARLFRVKNTVISIAGLGSLFSNRSLVNKIRRIFVYPLFKIVFNNKSSHIIFQNKNDLYLMQNWVKFLGRFSLVSGSGVNLKKFHNCNKENLDSKNIIFASRLLKEKGIYEFVSAGRIVKKIHPDAKIIIAGNIDPRNPSSISNKELATWEKEGLIEFLGDREDIPELLCLSNIVCLPSYYGEGLPKILQEASAAGRAIITTDHPGCRDAIEVNKSGFAIPIKNVNLLAEKIVHLLENPEKRLAFGNLGRKIAKSKFDIRIIVEQHLNIYKSFE